MNTESDERSGVAVAEIPSAQQEVGPGPREAIVEDRGAGEHREDDQLAPLFSADVASDFRSRWDAVQIGFVDDPRQAVRKADELVAQVMKNLEETFSSERAKFEDRADTADSASTENLRVALRHYRSFFQRLLSL